MLLQPDTILIQSNKCIVRRQENHYLIYNSVNDEMHLLPPIGYIIYELCDGLNSIEDIKSNLKNSLNEDNDNINKSIYKFFEQLIVRGIVKFDSGI